MRCATCTNAFPMMRVETVQNTNDDDHGIKKRRLSFSLHFLSSGQSFTCATAVPLIPRYVDLCEVHVWIIPG